MADTNKPVAGEEVEPKVPVVEHNDTTGYRAKADAGVENDEVLAQNVQETADQVESRGEADDPGQLSEELLGDYQRRVQMGVNPNDLTYEDDDDDEGADEEGKTGYKPEGSTEKPDKDKTKSKK